MNLRDNYKCLALLPLLTFLSLSVQPRQQEKDDLHRVEIENTQSFSMISNELIPNVESRFKIDGSNRTIWGYSAGGAFCTFVLCNEPQLFQKYIIVSRMSPRAVALLKQSKPDLRGLALKLYFCHGEYESSRATEFIALLKKDNLPGLEIKYEVLKGGHHFTIPSEGLTRGLKAVFNKENPGNIAQ